MGQTSGLAGTNVTTLGHPAGLSAEGTDLGVLVAATLTVGNTLRYMLNKSPEVTFVGYSVPHPAEPKMNLRLQTSGKPATDVLLDTLGKVFSVGEHVDTTFKSAVADFRRRQEQEALAQPDAPVALQ